MKACSGCKKTKEISEFHKNRCMKDGLTNECKICRCDRERKVQPQSRIRDRLKYQNDSIYRANKLKNNTNYVDRLRENPDDWEEYIMGQRVNRNKYTKNNRGICNEQSARYRASKLKLTPTWSDLKVIEKIYIKAHKMTDETGIDYHVDHIYPLQGELSHGLHIPINLQILERSENLKKSNKIPSEDGAIYMRGLT